ncbi:MAG: HD domain-containing protein [Gemmatimonadaceae bacterium]
MTSGYSDRINHAFAFAAKHHDQQVRKGTRFPYLTHAPNMAVILTRYGLDEDTVVAGILLDVVRDWVRDSYTRERLEHRVGDKFGPHVLSTVVDIAERRSDDSGVELAQEEQKEDLLNRLKSASDQSRWVCAADAVYNGSSLLADLRRTEFPDTMWSRYFGGREGTIRWYRRLVDRLAEVGFEAPIMAELLTVVEELELGTRESGVGSRESGRGTRR